MGVSFSFLNWMKSLVKGALSGLAQFLTTDSPLKIMKVIYFTLKAFFFLRYFNCVQNFWEKLVLYRIQCQKFIKVQGCLLLTFFHMFTQSSSFNSIIVQMSEKRHSSNRK